MKEILQGETPDEQHAIWKKGFESGREHTEPSKKTIEKIGELKIAQATLEANQKNLMEQNTKEHQEIKEALCELKNVLKESLDKKADKKDVESLSSDVEDLKGWKWKLTGIGIVVAFLIFIGRDIVVSYFSK
jgi:hypothetical protein